MKRPDDVGCCVRTAREIDKREHQKHCNSGPHGPVPEPEKLLEAGQKDQQHREGRKQGDVLPCLVRRQRARAKPGGEDRGLALEHPERKGHSDEHAQGPRGEE